MMISAYSAKFKLWIQAWAWGLIQGKEKVALKQAQLFCLRELAVSSSPWSLPQTAKKPVFLKSDFLSLWRDRQLDTSWYKLIQVDTSWHWVGNLTLSLQKAQLLNCWHCWTLLLCSRTQRLSSSLRAYCRRLRAELEWPKTHHTWTSWPGPAPPTRAPAQSPRPQQAPRRCGAGAARAREEEEGRPTRGG